MMQFTTGEVHVKFQTSLAEVQVQNILRVRIFLGRLLSTDLGVLLHQTLEKSHLTMSIQRYKCASIKDHKL